MDRLLLRSRTYLPKYLVIDLPIYYLSLPLQYQIIYDTTCYYSMASEGDRIYE